MTNFCTLFDSHYLTRGLAMYRSLVTTGDVFHLYIFCFDNETVEILRQMQLPYVTLVTLAEFESDELLLVKPTRSRGEYCWTCTSSIIRYSLDMFCLQEVTYIDADLYFYQKPSLLLVDFHASAASVLLTEHFFTPGFEKDLKYGRFCVQFMTFRNDPRGRCVLDWWISRCLEWCYARLENGRFGDQKYLDDWPDRFDGIYVDEHIGAGVANWNVQQYETGGTEKFPTVDGIPIVFFHFHGIRIYRSGICDIGYKPLSAKVVDILYRPYFGAIQQAEDDIARSAKCFSLNRIKDRYLWEWLISFMLRRPRGTYNVYKFLGALTQRELT